VFRTGDGVTRGGGSVVIQCPGCTEKVRVQFVPRGVPTEQLVHYCPQCGYEFDEPHEQTD